MGLSIFPFEFRILGKKCLVLLQDKPQYKTLRLQYHEALATGNPGDQQLLHFWRKLIHFETVLWRGNHFLKFGINIHIETSYCYLIRLAFGRLGNGEGYV